MNKNLPLPYSKIIWLHTSWNKLDDSEGVKSITRLVIFHREPYDQYSHFHMVLTTKWGNSEITLFFFWMGPMVPPQGCRASPVHTWGGARNVSMWHISVWVCNIKYYSYPQQYSDITPVWLQRKMRLKFSSISLPLFLSLIPSLCLSISLSSLRRVLFLSLRLCLSLGTSVIPDSLKGLFLLISLTLIYD